MLLPWIKLVDPEEVTNCLLFNQVCALRHAFEGAISKRDWPLIGRIDRLSGRIFNSYLPANCEFNEMIIAELTKIKLLYRQSIALLECEIQDLAQQAT